MSDVFSPRCRVDLTLLLPELTKRQAGVSEIYGLDGDLIIPTGSLSPPGILKQTRDRRGERTSAGYRNAKVIFGQDTANTLFGHQNRSYRRDALALGQGDILSRSQGLSLDIDPSGIARFATKAYVPYLEGAEADWRRNPMSQPDEFDVTIRADQLPIDIRILRGAQVDAWLYTHGNPSRCRRGQPGHFGGIVRSMRRTRSDGEDAISLTCVDYTWSLMKAKLTPDMLAVTLDQSFADVVRGLLANVPGADAWKVLGQSDRDSAKDALGVRERRKKEKVSLGRGLNPSNGGTFGDQTAREFSVVVSPTQARVVYRDKVKTVITQPTIGHIMGTADADVWATILKLASLVGLVPNYGMSADGEPTIAILTAEEAQTVSRGFQRTLTWGVDLLEMGESIEFDGGPKVDGVEVRSMDPDTGRTYSGRVGRSVGGATSGNVEIQVAHGLASDAECEARAGEIWRSYWRGEFGLTISTAAPWSLGGGPDSPNGSDDYLNDETAVGRNSDLLAAEPGEPVQIRFDGLEAAAREVGLISAKAEVQRTNIARAFRKILRDRSLISEDDAERIVEAMYNEPQSTLFAIREISHSYDGVGDGGYTCTLTLDAYLGHSEDRPYVQRDDLFDKLGLHDS